MSQHYTLMLTHSADSRHSQLVFVVPHAPQPHQMLQHECTTDPVLPLSEHVRLKGGPQGMWFTQDGAVFRNGAMLDTGRRLCALSS